MDRKDEYSSKFSKEHVFCVGESRDREVAPTGKFNDSNSQIKFFDKWIECVMLLTHFSNCWVGIKFINNRR